MKRYEAYKHIESPWFSSIPIHWNIQRLKNATSYISRGQTPLYTDDSSCAMVVNQATFSRGYWNLKNVRYTSVSPIDNPNVPQRGDILLASTGGGVLGKVFYFDEQGEYIADSHVTIIRTNSMLDARYLYLHLLTHFSTINAYLAKGSTNQTELQEQLLKNTPISIPPCAEQDQIVRYLDWQVSKINRLIAAKRKQIKLVREQRQQRIERIILHGLKADIELTNSEHWFGSIPAHWQVKRVKNLFELRDERNHLPLSQVNLISLYTSIGVVQNKDIEYKTGNRASNADNYKIVYEDDIIVNIILCWMGATGRSAYNGVTSPAYDVYKPYNSVCSRYYHYMFRLPAFSGECKKAGHGIMEMRWRTYSEDFLRIYVPVPPLEEQIAIADWLDEKQKKLQDIVEPIEREIMVLQELRTRLISDVVTGQIDVRGIEVPECFDECKDIADESDGQEAEIDEE